MTMLTSPRRLLSFALIALSLLLGCSAKRALPPTTPKTPSSILSQAQSACEQGEYTRCLRLNQGLLKRGHLSPKDAVQAWQGVVHSALALGRNKLALHGLEQW